MNKKEKGFLCFPGAVIRLYTSLSSSLEALRVLSLEFTFWSFKVWQLLIQRHFSLNYWKLALKLYFPFQIPSSVSPLLFFNIIFVRQKLDLQYLSFNFLVPSSLLSMFSYFCCIFWNNLFAVSFRVSINLRTCYLYYQIPIALSYCHMLLFIKHSFDISSE